MITVTKDLLDEMKRKGYTETTLGPLVGLSQQNFSHRKRGNIDWRITECYAILDILNIPRVDITKYFKGR